MHALMAIKPPMSMRAMLCFQPQPLMPVVLPIKTLPPKLPQMLPPIAMHSTLTN